MLLISGSIMEEARKEAKMMLATGKATLSELNNEEKTGNGASMMAVSTKEECLIGATSLEVEGKKFFVGINKKNLLQIKRR